MFNSSSNTFIILVTTQYNHFSVAEMAPRVPKIVAHDLIQYAKNLNVTAHAFSPASISAMEFHRQMNSPKLHKINPSFECKLNLLKSLDSPATVSAEFLDGSKWELESAAHSAAELRSMFFEKAALAEDSLGDSDPAGGKKK